MTKVSRRYVIQNIKSQSLKQVLRYLNKVTKHKKRSIYYTDLFLKNIRINLFYKCCFVVSIIKPSIAIITPLSFLTGDAVKL